MKIVLEFDNIESFFSQLPRFASLMNFSGQFANITQKPKTATEPTLDEPDLPVIERPEPGVTRVHGTKTETAEEAGKKIETAYDAAAAAEVAAGPAKPEEQAEEAEAPEELTEAPPKAQRGGKGKKSTEKPTPAEEPAQAPPEAAQEVKDTDVRKVMNKLIKAGKRDTVKTILSSFGAANFTALKPKDYAAVLKKAKEALEDE